MLNKIWEEILNNKQDYELLCNGVEVSGCDYAHMYYNQKTHEFITVGFDKMHIIKYLKIAID